MEWVKLSTRYYHDPAVASLDDTAELMFVRGLAYAGAEETSGFIPETVVPSLTRRRRHQAAVEALVAHSLWIPCQGHRGQPGYLIARWEDWQEELEALARRRAADRQRKRTERRKKQQVKGMSRDLSAHIERKSETERTTTQAPTGLRPYGAWTGKTTLRLVSGTGMSSTTTGNSVPRARANGRREPDVTRENTP